MNTPLIYVKKLRLPSRSANVFQSLNMALAFGEAGADVHCFPGCSNRNGESTTQTLHHCLADILPVARQNVSEDSPHTGSIGLSGATVASSPHWHLLSPTHKGLYSLFFRLAVAREAMRHPKAVLYARDVPEANFLCGMKRYIDRPLVFEAHEVLYMMHQHDGKNWRKTQHYEQRIFSSLAGLVATSKLVAENTREYLGYQGPILVAPNGYSAAAFHPLPLFEPEHPWPEKDEPVKLVYVGNFHPGKGVDELLDAMNLLPDRFSLRIIGGNPASALERMREKVRTLGLEQRVEFTGAVPQHEVRAACAGSHIFVIPQQSEFFFSPLKLYEAFALGLPVLTLPLGVFQDPCSRSLVHTAPDTTPQGLAIGLEQLASTPALAERLRADGLTEAAPHSWSGRARTVLEFIRGL